MLLKQAKQQAVTGGKRSVSGGRDVAASWGFPPCSYERKTLTCAECLHSCQISFNQHATESTCEGESTHVSSN